METNNSEIWAIIPARSGSKGVKDKNIMELAGYPLIAYSIAVAKKCSNIDRVIVTTDSKAYEEISLKYGADVPFLRPSAISGDEATDLQFFQHTVEWFRENFGHVPKYFVHLRPTTPLRESEVIDEAILSFIDSNHTALRSVHRMSDTSYKTFEIENGILKMLFDGGFNIESTILPRQAFPVTFSPNGYVDIIRTSMVDQGLIHGDNVQAFITDITYEIDSIEDFDWLDYLVSKNPCLSSKIFK